MDTNFAIADLHAFLLASARGGYAAEFPDQDRDEPDGSHTVTFSQGDWRSHDNFFGGEPYGGRIVVSYVGKPVWIMVYYGHASESFADTKPIYEMLLTALKAVPEEMPLRGPAELVKGEWKYANLWTGTIKRFSGEEQIYVESKKVYEANYMGGLVDGR